MTEIDIPIHRSGFVSYVCPTCKAQIVTNQPNDYGCLDCDKPLVVQELQEIR